MDLYTPIEFEVLRFWKFVRLALILIHWVIKCIKILNYYKNDFGRKVGLFLQIVELWEFDLSLGKKALLEVCQSKNKISL